MEQDNKVCTVVGNVIKVKLTKEQQNEILKEKLQKMKEYYTTQVHEYEAKIKEIKQEAGIEVSKLRTKYETIDIPLEDKPKKEKVLGKPEIQHSKTGGRIIWNDDLCNYLLDSLLKEYNFSKIGKELNVNSSALRKRWNDFKLWYWSRKYRNSSSGDYGENWYNKGYFEKIDLIREKYKDDEKIKMDEHLYNVK